MPGRRRRLLDFIAARGWTRIGESEWPELTAAFPRITVAALLKAGLAVDQPFRGVEQHTLDELEASLIELARIYELRPDLRRFVRDQVIKAKDRAGWASRNQRADEVTRRRKAEMREWMLVWLDDPAMFATWAGLRRTHLERGVLPPEHAEKDHIIRPGDE